MFVQATTQPTCFLIAGFFEGRVYLIEVATLFGEDSRPASLTCKQSHLPDPISPGNRLPSTHPRRLG